MSLLRKGRQQINKNTYYTNQITQQLGYQQGVLPLLESEKNESTNIAGMISAYMGSNDPAGWLICDGRELIRTMYPNLFAIIGTTYGVGDGMITFKIPDLRGSFLRGAGTNSLNSNYAGPALNQYQTHATESHSHTITDPGHKHVFDSANDDFNNSTANYPDALPATTHSTGFPSFPKYDSGTTHRWLNPNENNTTGITVNESLEDGLRSNVETRPFNCGINWIIKY